MSASTPLTHLLVVLGLGCACGLWVLVQRWIGRVDPEQPGVEGAAGCGHEGERCGGCEEPCDGE